MSTRQTLLVGFLLATFAGLLVDHGAHLGAQVVQTALLGTALGAVLGMVHTGGSLARTVGFVAGFAFSWLGFALRAGALPDIPAGRAIATSVVVLLITGVTAASRGRIPMFAGLLGAAAMTGAYEFQFATNPTAFTSDSITAATTALLCASLGFLATEVGSAVLQSRTTATVETPSAAAVPLVDPALPQQRDAAHDAAVSPVMKSEA